MSFNQNVWTKGMFYNKLSPLRAWFLKQTATLKDVVLKAIEEPSHSTIRLSVLLRWFAKIND